MGEFDLELSLDIKCFTGEIFMSSLLFAKKPKFTNIKGLYDQTKGGAILELKSRRGWKVVE
jgi:hypothetical protein